MTEENAGQPAPHLHLRVVFGPGAMLGPGKARLLEAIRATGSISAASRSMNMSYKRAWMLVENLNATFREPLVDSTRGGARGGGAVLTEAGETVLARYRTLEARAAEAGAGEIASLASILKEGSEGE